MGKEITGPLAKKKRWEVNMRCSLKLCCVFGPLVDSMILWLASNPVFVGWNLWSVRVLFCGEYFERVLGTHQECRIKMSRLRARFVLKIQKMNFSICSWQPGHPGCTQDLMFRPYFWGYLGVSDFVTLNPFSLAWTIRFPQAETMDVRHQQREERCFWEMWGEASAPKHWTSFSPVSEELLK